MNYAQNIFQSDGKWYTLNITLLPDADIYPDENAVALDAQGIERFTYISELNKLVMTGKIIYVDKYGDVDKFLEHQHCECDVMFAENKTKKDGTIVDSQIDEQNMFSHSFIVDSIKIIERQRSMIKYEIDLVSWNWYSCSKNLAVTNWKDEPQSVLEVLKTSITDAGLNANDTFESVKVDIPVNFIAQANDNLFTVLRYCLRRLYFYSSRDTSLKFLVYSQYKNEYGLIDIADQSTFMGMSTTVLSFFKTNAEQLLMPNESNIGSYSNGSAKTDMYNAMFSKRVYNYDFDSNSLTADTAADNTALVNFMNQHMSYDDYALKYHELTIPDKSKHICYESYWNHIPDTYFSIIDAMYSNGALTLNTSGQVMRQCGYAVTLAVDRSMTALNDSSSQELKDLKTKYTGFDGTWLALKVVSIVCPRENAFRQQIALFRNYTKSPKPPKETVVQ